MGFKYITDSVEAGPHQQTLSSKFQANMFSR